VSIQVRSDRHRGARAGGNQNVAQDPANGGL